MKSGQSKVVRPFFILYPSSFILPFPTRSRRPPGTHRPCPRSGCGICTVTHGLANRCCKLVQLLRRHENRGPRPQGMLLSRLPPRRPLQDEHLVLVAVLVRACIRRGISNSRMVKLGARSALPIRQRIDSPTLLRCPTGWREYFSVVDDFHGRNSACTAPAAGVRFRVPRAPLAAQTNPENPMMRVATVRQRIRRTFSKTIINDPHLLAVVLAWPTLPASTARASWRRSSPLGRSRDKQAGAAIPRRLQWRKYSDWPHPEDGGPQAGQIAKPGATNPATTITVCRVALLSPVALLMLG